MKFRIYGDEPIRAVVVHGGPGAAGSVKPVCEELSKVCSVLEPFQTETTVEGQLLELKNILEETIIQPVTLIGHSWGGMLIFMFAAKYPQLVKKIILVSSGMLEEEQYAQFAENRENRLSDDEKQELRELQRVLFTDSTEDKNRAFARLGAIMDRIDSYNPINIINDDSMVSFDIYNKIWPEAHAMRKRGDIIKVGRGIQCDTVAIHGTYDSHPAESIRASLKKVKKGVAFYLLENCGHTPWLETYARDGFYEILKGEVV